MVMKLSKKDINNIRGALRQASFRSDWRKDFVDSKRINLPKFNKDGKRSKIDLSVWVCATCKHFIKAKYIKVDHIDPIGSFKSLDDVGFMSRVFCEYGNLQILCEDCHKVKTWAERLKF